LSRGEIFKAKLAPTDIFKPLEISMLQLAPRRCVGANSHLATLKKLPSGCHKIKKLLIKKATAAIYSWRWLNKKLLL
jgi:hypothetical protein